MLMKAAAVIARMAMHILPVLHPRSLTPPSIQHSTEARARCTPLITQNRTFSVSSRHAHYQLSWRIDERFCSGRGSGDVPLSHSRDSLPSPSPYSIAHRTHKQLKGGVNHNVGDEPFTSTIGIPSAVSG